MKAHTSYAFAETLCEGVHLVFIMQNGELGDIVWKYTSFTNSSVK